MSKFRRSERRSSGPGAVDSAVEKRCVVELRFVLITAVTNPRPTPRSLAGIRVRVRPTKTLGEQTIENLLLWRAAGRQRPGQRQLVGAATEECAQIETNHTAAEKFKLRAEIK